MRIKFGKNKAEYLAVAAAASAVYAAMVWLAGSKTLCFYKNVFGIPCPGCGLTRAIVWFFRGDPARAFAFHPLFPLVILCLSVIVFRAFGPFKRLYHNQVFWIGSLILLVGVWIARMYFYFPLHEPMTFHHHSLASQVMKLVSQAFRIFLG